MESKAQSPDSSPDDLAMLSKPFALAQSFEVAKHLDQQYALKFVKLLTSCADIVLFSAAIPYQGGVCHINSVSRGIGRSCLGSVAMSALTACALESGAKNLCYGGIGKIS